MIGYEGYGTGSRKSATARVYLKKGKGNFTINSSKIDKYFAANSQQVLSAESPLVCLGERSKFDVVVRVKGGGYTGQADAVCMGLARALCDFEGKQPQKKSEKSKEIEEEGEDENTVSVWRCIMRKKGYLTRDSRKVERSKVGFRGARKRPQYSKR